ncbi:MAG: hypothetical protein ACTSRU_18730 [Candidatus Hodarchaeales archaeon]
MVSSESRIKSFKTPSKSKYTFYSGSGKKIATVKNISELITVMADLEPLILHFHISHDIRDDFNGTSSPGVNGPVIKIDLPFWLSHALGEPELATKILDLSIEYSNDSMKLKDEVIKACKEVETLLLKKMVKKK